MGNTSVLRVLALILVGALIATACTSDSESAGSPDSSEESSDPAQGDGEPPGGQDGEGAGGDASPSPVDLGDFTGPTEIDDTALSVDDDIRIGTLDNGLTYYVRSNDCLLYTSPSPRDRTRSRMPSSA